MNSSEAAPKFGAAFFLSRFSKLYGQEWNINRHLTANLFIGIVK